MQTDTVHYHFTSISRDNQAHQSVFALRLESCPSARLFYDLLKNDHIPISNRFSSFIACLHHLEFPVTYALRLIVMPGLMSNSSGQAKFIFFAKTSASEATAAYRQSLQVEQQLLSLLGGFFGEYIWQPVRDAQEFESLWQPMDWNHASIAEIIRREEYAVLDQIKPHNPIGFGKQNKLDENDEDDTQKIYQLCPFHSEDEEFEEILQTLMLQPAPFVYTVSISPTWIKEEEKDFLLGLIARCEQPDFKYTEDDVMRIYRRRARMLLESLMEQYDRLQNQPFNMRVTIASPEKIPPVLINAIGNYISPFPKTKNRYSGEDLLDLHEGGFAICLPRGQDEKHLAAMQAKDLTHWEWDSAAKLKVPARLKHLFSSDEAASAFRFPVATDQNLPGMTVHDFRRQPLPQEIIDLSSSKRDDLCLVGTNEFLGSRQPVHISDRDRLRHMYVVGQTGTGKTTLLKNMILSDMRAGKGVAVIDPHGDLFQELICSVPPERVEDTVVFDPVDTDYPVGFNLLECADAGERHFVVREMRAIMEKYVQEKYGRRAPDYAGPVFFKHLQMNMLLAMSDDRKPGTILEFYEIFNHRDYWKKWLPLRWNDSLLKVWVENVLPTTDYPYRRNPQECSIGEYVNSKFDDFVFDPSLRLIFGQRHTTFHIDEIMQKGRILLVNLAKGKLGDANAGFLGMLLMAKFQSEVMKRGKLPPEERTPFYLYVDEFQNLATQSFAALLSEARKFGVGLILANQFLSQIANEKIIDAVFGNVGTIAAFRVGREDAEQLQSLFLPEIAMEDLCDLPNWTCAVRASSSGEVIAPFLMQNIYEDKPLDEQIGKTVRSFTRNHYAGPRDEVEKEILEYLQVSQETGG